ncbi:unnamed protein product [Phaedon cochleariae]|uniref:Uncharacterized protein n=1 Tax=Phaedon cochleariae TaxID=80249 RepID=A0A9N9SB22_PHACE|nr:unnamed protein product [Phaedon cochleariae]
MKNIFIMFSALLVFISTPVTPSLSKSDYGKEFLALSQILHNTCIKASGTTQEMIDKVSAGEFLDEAKIKKYVSCVWLESTIIGKNGELNIELGAKLCPPKVKSSFPKDVEECWAKSGKVTPLEDRIYDMVKCTYQKNPNNFIMF